MSKKSKKHARAKKHTAASLKVKGANDKLVWHLSAEEATLAKKPHYNGYACGYGAHGTTKYNRAKQKRAAQKFLNEQGASNIRLLSFWPYKPLFCFSFVLIH